jgi:hypothetical protein
MRTQPVNGQNAQHEQHPLAQVRNPEDIKKLLKHDRLSASGRFRRSNLCHCLSYPRRALCVVSLGAPGLDFET